MESITLQQVLPDAFAGNPEPPKSDLWLHDVTFRKGEYYLVTTGKIQATASRQMGKG